MILSHTMLRGPDGVRVRLAGEIDLAVREDLRVVLATAIATTSGVVELDLDEVAFLDCTGIGEVVRAYHEARRRGRRLVVTRPHGIVRRVLQLTDVLPLLAPESAVKASSDG
jgi:anti-sigma B factor antagonist